MEERLGGRWAGRKSICVPRRRRRGVRLRWMSTGPLLSLTSNHHVLVDPSDQQAESLLQLAKQVRSSLSVIGLIPPFSALLQGDTGLSSCFLGDMRWSCFAHPKVPPQNAALRFSVLPTTYFLHRRPPPWGRTGNCGFAGHTGKEIRSIPWLVSCARHRVGTHN